LGATNPIENFEQGRPSTNGHGPIADEQTDNQIELTIVVPTRNERENVAALLSRLDRVAPNVSAEILFVDDSDDRTDELVAEIGRTTQRMVRLIHRNADRRTNGLSGAVVEGVRAARGQWICVIDGDLQHPPELIAQMIERSRAGDCELVLASRYCGDGDSGFGIVRSLLSRGSNAAARAVFPLRLRGVSDPMSGFFMVRRASIDLERLRPKGFKILLEILATHPWLRRAEVSFEFGTRHAGESKASLQQGMTFLSQLARLRVAGRMTNLGRFGVVGGLGLVVNMAVFALLATGIGLQYVVAAIIATQASTLCNFVLTERWVFRRRSSGFGGGLRMALYFLMNNAALLLRAPFLVLLVSGMGFGKVVANFLSLVALTLVRFAVADSFIWREGAQQRGPHFYDVHGLVTVRSEVALPELASFRTELPIAVPSISVSIGKLSGRQSDLVAALSHQGRHVRYDEGLGAAGFAVDIGIGKTVDVVASPLLRLSPHVLYTNVVEPILRWTFVRKGYALVHAACISVGDEACLLTARTDTGKTTTILKTLDHSACSFLSDDLTLISSTGHVLTYPKPLTISRHTAAAVKTPLLTLGERVRLVYQSRIHSRSGRRFAFLVSRLHLPAATINAIVQMIVPPPKYHVRRLIPNVRLAQEASLTRLIVIERGGEGSVELDSRQALETLLSNCEDAYGFPPYSAIAPSLYRGRNRDLRLAERKIIASALDGIPALVLRSESMDWWQRLRLLMGVTEREPVVHDAALAPAIPTA